MQNYKTPSKTLKRLVMPEETTLTILIVLKKHKKKSKMDMSFSFLLCISITVLGEVITPLTVLCAFTFCSIIACYMIHMNIILGFTEIKNICILRVREGLEKSMLE